jgi:hypothetical protein
MKIVGFIEEAATIEKILLNYSALALKKSIEGLGTVASKYGDN